MKFNFNLPGDKMWEVAVHGIIAGIAVAGTYVLQHITASDFGSFGYAIVGIISVLVAVVTKAANNEVVPVALPQEEKPK